MWRRAKAASDGLLEDFAGWASCPRRSKDAPWRFIRIGQAAPEQREGVRPRELKVTADPLRAFHPAAPVGVMTSPALALRSSCLSA